MPHENTSHTNPDETNCSFRSDDNLCRNYLNVFHIFKYMIASINAVCVIVSGNINFCLNNHYLFVFYACLF